MLSECQLTNASDLKIRFVVYSELASGSEWPSDLYNHFQDELFSLSYSILRNQMIQILQNIFYTIIASGALQSLLPFSQKFFLAIIDG